MTLNDLYNCFLVRGATGDTPVRLVIRESGKLLDIPTYSLKVIEEEKTKFCIIKIHEIIDL